jgi:hypothetical protein
MSRRRSSPGRGLVPIPGSVAIPGRCGCPGSPCEGGGASNVLRTWWGGDTSPMKWLLRSNLWLLIVNVLRARKMSGKNAGFARS